MKKVEDITFVDQDIGVRGVQEGDSVNQISQESPQCLAHNLLLYRAQGFSVRGNLHSPP